MSSEKRRMRLGRGCNFSVFVRVPRENCLQSEGCANSIPVGRPVSAFCGCSYGLSRGVAVDGAIARGGGCAGYFAGSVAVNGPVSVCRGCPDDSAMSIPNGLPFRAKSG